MTMTLRRGEVAVDDGEVIYAVYAVAADGQSDVLLAHASDDREADLREARREAEAGRVAEDIDWSAGIADD